MRPCLHRGCPVLVRPPATRCDDHAPATQHGWRQDTTRIRGRRNQQLRRHLFAEEPLCRLCLEAGRTAAATIRDHIIPLAEGGTEEPANIQPLCRPCSDAKTQQEAQRGRRRA